MKKSVLFLILLSAYYLCAAQEDIPRKTNMIVITDTISAASYWSKITEILFENGYGILSSDKESGIITTSERAFKNGIIKLNILIKDKRIVIRGDYKDNISLDLAGGVSVEPSWSEIKYSGQKNSILMNAWDELYKLAEYIPGTKEYLVK